MAEHLRNNLELGWGRTPEGRLYVQAGTMVQVGGQPRLVPMYTWVLSEEEEAKLDGKIHGLTVAAKMPELVH